MSEMVERVAKAMERAALAFGPPTFAQTHQLTDFMARAAIEAMRNLTDEMRDAGFKNNFGNYADAAWYAMIDAALSTTHNPEEK